MQTHLPLKLFGLKLIPFEEKKFIHNIGITEGRILTSQSLTESLRIDEIYEDQFVQTQ